jgi:hypothetical protein
MLRYSPPEEQICQTIQHRIMGEFPANIYSQALAGEFIQNSQHPEATAISGPGMYEVITPHVIAMLRTEPHTGTVIEPESSAFRLTLWYLQTFPPPESFYPFVINLPAVIAQQRCNTSIPVPTILQ